MNEKKIQVSARQSFDQEWMQYTIAIPTNAFERMEFSESEKELLDNVKKVPTDALAFTRALTMVVMKIQGLGIKKEWQNNNSFGNIEAMFVDHLVMNLEKRSIADIVIFLCKYCGWDRIRNYMDKKLNRMEENKNG